MPRRLFASLKIHQKLHYFQLLVRKHTIPRKQMGANLTQVI